MEIDCGSVPSRGKECDGISPDLCSLQYVKVEDVTRRLMELGPGAEMAKMDVRSAYCVVLIHPFDHIIIHYSGCDCAQHPRFSTQ